jgi:hypothetical protein
VKETYRFNNGEHTIEPGKTRVSAVRVISNEDWKTAMAHGQRSFEVGEQATLSDAIVNFYGSYARVQFDNVDFSVYVKWSDLNWVG